MRTGAARDARSARRQHQAALQTVEHECEQHGPRRQGQPPAVDHAPERQDEHEEPEILTEDRVDRSERLGVLVPEDDFPVHAGPQSRHGGDRQQDDGQEAADERFDHHAAGQAELVLQLPQHVGRGGAGGEHEVRGQEDQDRDHHRGEQGAAQRQRRPEDARVADLAEPQPVRVERHDLGADRQQEEQADQEQDRLRPSHGTILFIVVPASSSSCLPGRVWRRFRAAVRPPLSRAGRRPVPTGQTDP